MKNFNIRTAVALSFFCAVIVSSASLAIAADADTTPVANAKSDDFTAGKKALEAKNWALAASSFQKAATANPQSADAWNLLGYSSRWMGKYDDAFAAYDKALTLDPSHKGALEYSGIAYLKVNQKAKADVQLARLKTICASCQETADLAKAVAEYKP